MEIIMNDIILSVALNYLSSH